MKENKIIDIDQIRLDRSDDLEDIETNIMIGEVHRILSEYGMEIAFSQEDLAIIYKAFRKHMKEKYPTKYYDPSFLNFFSIIVTSVNYNGISTITLDDFIEAIDSCQNCDAYDYLTSMKPLIESEIAKIQKGKEKGKVITFKPIDDQKK